MHVLWGLYNIIIPSQEIHYLLVYYTVPHSKRRKDTRRLRAERAHQTVMKTAVRAVEALQWSLSLWDKSPAQNLAWRGTTLSWTTSCSCWRHRTCHKMRTRRHCSLRALVNHLPQNTWNLDESQLQTLIYSTQLNMPLQDIIKTNIINVSAQYCCIHFAYTFCEFCEHQIKIPIVTSWQHETLWWWDINHHWNFHFLLKLLSLILFHCPYNHSSTPSSPECQPLTVV